MKKALRAALDYFFDQEIPARFAGFSRVIVNNSYFSRGDHLYERKSGKIYEYILIEEHLKGEDSFRIEVGWSVLGRPPELTGRPTNALMSEKECLKLDEALLCILTLKGLFCNFWHMDSLTVDENLKESIWLLEEFGDIKRGASPFSVLQEIGIPLLEMKRNTLVSNSSN